MTRLRFLISLLTLGSSLASNGWAQKSAARHASPSVQVMQKQTEGSISVAFAQAKRSSQGTPGYKTLDLGAVSYGVVAQSAATHVRRLSDRFIVETEFGLDLEDPSLHSRTAMLLASTVYPASLYVISVDGVKLGASLQVVQAQAPLGKVSSHRLEIEIPDTVTEKDSQFHNGIVFQVIPN